MQVSIPKLHSIKFKDGGFLRPVKSDCVAATEQYEQLGDMIRQGKIHSFLAVAVSSGGVHTAYHKATGIRHAETIGWCVNLQDVLMKAWEDV